MNRQRARNCLAILAIGEVISEEKKTKHQGKTREWMRRGSSITSFANRGLKTRGVTRQCSEYEVFFCRRFHERNIVVVPCKRA